MRSWALTFPMPLAPAETKILQKEQQAEKFLEFCEMTACPGYLEGGSGFAVDGEMAFCSGHGVCNGTRTVKSSSGLDDERLSMGTCKCGAGFTGVDCSVPFGLRPAHEVAREIEELAKE